MNLNADLFLHPTDKAAMAALKAIPGFSTFVKAYMEIWNERQFRIINMSSKLKVSEKQMKKYYDMLPPICEKLGIDVPELYIELNVNPNAYTYGDKNPFIVITSGLFETIPEELIPTVLAHECGHIACHHTMFTTMGQMILNGANYLPGMASLVTIPLQIAFAYWMRCSEFSADRVATICDGSPDKMIEVCMRLAGYDKDISEEGNIEAFMEQAIEYRELVANDAWNKSLEFLLFNQMDHPLNAVRAYESREWGASDQYDKICNLIAKIRSFNPDHYEIPVYQSADEFLKMDYESVLEFLHDNGFSNVTLVRTIEPKKGTKDDQVVSVSIANTSSFERCTWFENDAPIEITYYKAETMEEMIEAHGGKHQVPDSAKKYAGRNLDDVVGELKNAGFINIVASGQKTKKNIFTKENSIIQITIEGQTDFEKGVWFDPDAYIQIFYVEFI